LLIEGVSTTPQFTVTAVGDYTIHTLIYDADPNSPNFLDLSVVQIGVTTGIDVFNIINQNGLCASLDVAGAGFHVQPCTADAGTIDPSVANLTLTNGAAMLVGIPQGDAVVPAGYSTIFVLTSGNNLLIEAVSTTPQFTVTAAGDYKIHTLIYDGDSTSPNFLDLSVVVFGQTTGIDVVNLISQNGLCASLDVAGAGFHVQPAPVCTADAGTITADFANVSLVGGSATLTATPDGNINVPAGYSVLYVLTSGPNLMIEQVAATPSFTVSSTGLFTIHTLVYDADSTSPDFLDLSIVVFGQTTGGDVVGVVTANNICASLDVAGAPIHVNACLADAGTITADFSDVSLVGGSATLTATPDGNINVPAGYSVLYVLTSGQNLVIEQVAATPSFNVTSTGLFTIHTLVYNADSTSSDFLDLSVVQFGTTTGGDVVGLVTANGICASLDVAGAPINVNACLADAGTIKSTFSNVSLVNGSATLTGIPQGNATVPAGYSTLYVLTSGSNLVIEQVSTTPSFTVSATGNYTIHTLIYNADSTSSDFLDLSVVVFGTTTGVDVLNLVAQNGICASLDVAGAGVSVNDCLADAGTITPDFVTVSQMGGSATLTATPDGNINVPTGYSVLYVLTSGQNLVIEQVAATPSFTVTGTGLYTIHTLVYNADSTSSDFLDLSVVQFGTTTGGDVVGIVTANGICASLDVAGAPITVTPMIVINFVDLELLLPQFRTAGSVTVLWEVSSTIKDGLMIVEKSVDGVVFTGLEQIEMATTRDAAQTFQVSDLLADNSEVYYRIKFIDPTGLSSYSEVVSTANAQLREQAYVAFPNPVEDALTIDYPGEGIRLYQVVDLSGRIMLQGELEFTLGSQPEIDMSNLNPGVYQLMLINTETGDKTMIKVIKN
ncbi:MAG: T9SS type A sorting domain-containing protein, partial [Bacteroidota bacterium]